MFKWINNNKQVVLVTLVILPTVVVMLTFLINLRDKYQPPEVKGKEDTIHKVSFPDSDREILVDVADTDSERAKGLMGVEELPYNQGMLFIYADPVRNGFWMKNTLIPLDMIFIDMNWNIVDIIEYAEPCEKDTNCPSYQPSSLYQYVVEVNGGFANEYGIEEGDPVIYKIL